MANEVTLDELVKSSNNNSDNANKKVGDAKKETVNMTPSSFKGGSKASLKDLGAKLEDKNPKVKKEVTDAPLVKDAFKAMNDTLAEKKKFYDEKVIPVMMENAREMAMERELGIDENGNPIDLPDDDQSANNNTDEIPSTDDFAILGEESKEEVVESIPKLDNIGEMVDPIKNNKPTKSNKNTEIESTDVSMDNVTLDDMMKDLGLDEEIADDEEEETTEELRERFKESLSDIHVTKDPLDLSKFKISTTPMSSAMVLNVTPNATKKRCDHPLMHTGRNMTFEECTGPELDALRKTINGSNGINAVIASIRFVYNHVIDANKPNFETWCKTIRTEDVESLYFGIYKACYGSTNLIAREDRKTDDGKGCGKTSLINTNINDMIEFADDDAKELYNKLLSMDSTTAGKKISSNIIPISDDFALSYSDPTIYSTFIQYATLQPDITRKYSDQLNTMAYINGFYRIDAVNSQLIPISIKEYPKNLNKTVMSKLKTYTDILKTLTNDQYNIMIAKLDNIIGDTKISYVNPETTCPECGNTMPKEPIDSMLNLLFLRAQLVQVKSL